MDFKNISPQNQLYSACFNNDIELVETLIEGGLVDVNGKDGWGATPLTTASSCGNYVIVSLLIKNGAEVNKKALNGVEYTALHAASYYSHYEVAEILLKGGASLSEKDVNGQTPLHWIAKNKEGKGIFELFLKNGSKINEPDKYGWTALHHACCNNCYEVVVFLLKNGADKTIKNSHGETPQDVANIKGYIHIDSLCE